MNDPQEKTDRTGNGSNVTTELYWPSCYIDQRYIDAPVYLISESNMIKITCQIIKVP